MKNVRKKSLAGLLFIGLVFLTFTSCDGCKQNGDDNKPKEEVKAPEQIVTVVQARKMYDNYSKHRVPIIQKYEDSSRQDRKDYKIQQNKMQKQEAGIEKDTFDVARYGYYDLDTMKQYIAYIEQEAARANVNISSLRFYFSNYPDKKEIEGRPILHPKQNSFFLIPTIEKGEREYAFFIREKEPGKWHPVLLSDQLEELGSQGLGAVYKTNDKVHASIVPSLTTSSSSPTYLNDTSLTMNEVDMVPPPHQ